jgi:hypothetical protein
MIIGRYIFSKKKKKKQEQEQAYNVVIITVTSRSSYKKVSSKVDMYIDRQCIQSTKKKKTVVFLYPHQVYSCANHTLNAVYSVF